MFAFIAGDGPEHGRFRLDRAFGVGDTGKVKPPLERRGIALLFAVGIALIGSLFARALLLTLATPPNILNEATAYARVTMISMPLTYAVILVTAMMRGVGDTITPLLALVIYTLIGLVATPAMIAGWFGLPPLGVASAAWASVASSVLTLMWLYFHLQSRRHPLAFDQTLLRAMWPDAAARRYCARHSLR